jgi:hypothetical protein
MGLVTTEPTHHAAPLPSTMVLREQHKTMMKSPFRLLIVISLTQIGAFAPLVQVHKLSVTRWGSSSSSTDELQAVWSRAAQAGADAVQTTADLVKDRAFDYKQRAVGRIQAMPTEEFVEGESTGPTMKFNADYQEALARAEERFLRAVAKAEEKLAHSIHCGETTYDRDLKREKHWTNDVILRAKNLYIQRTAAAEELFQIAVEKAELGFEEAKIKADDMRNRHMDYFQEYGEYMHDEMPYLSSHFGNLIAF